MLIRKATINDAECIATHLLLAMEDIVYKFIGERDPAKAREFMLHFAGRQTNQYSYENCWVAVVEQEVVATVNLYDGARLHELRQPVIEHIRSRFNRDIMPGDETAAGEYYIDSLGVSTNQQGNGVGSKLVQFLIEEYANKRTVTLGLLVDEENQQAKRLYLKLGFKTAGRKVLFEKNMEHLQIRMESFREIAANSSKED